MLTITWPVEANYTTGGTFAVLCGLIDFSYGSPDIEGRIEGELMFHPKGKPVVTAGAHP